MQQLLCPPARKHSLKVFFSLLGQMCAYEWVRFLLAFTLLPRLHLLFFTVNSIILSYHPPQCSRLCHLPHPRPPPLACHTLPSLCPSRSSCPTRQRPHCSVQSLNQLQWKISISNEQKFKMLQFEVHLTKFPGPDFEMWHPWHPFFDQNQIFLIDFI